MNLHGIVRGAITSVNPDISATLLRSNGYSTDASGKQIPAYLTFTGKIQVQGLGFKEIQHMDNLNIQGVLATVYLRGNWAGVVRADQKGGDVMKFPQIVGGPIETWRVVNVNEVWPDWCSVIVALQSVPIP
jgi:hypothetical protein